MDRCLCSAQLFSDTVVRLVGQQVFSLANESEDEENIIIHNVFYTSEPAYADAVSKISFVLLYLTCISALKRPHVNHSLITLLSFS